MRRHLALGTALSTILSSAVLSTGCSFVLTSGPRDSGKPPKAYPECTTNHTWPVVDGVFGSLMLLSAISIASSDNSSDQTDSEQAQSGITAFILSAAAITGSVVGFRRVSRCR